MLSHQLKQGKIDGEKTIIQNPNEAQRKEHEKCDFELHEVYAIDVLVSTGEGIVSGLILFVKKQIKSNRGFSRAVKRTPKCRSTRKLRKTTN